MRRATDSFRIHREHSPGRVPSGRPRGAPWSSGLGSVVDDGSVPSPQAREGNGLLVRPPFVGGHDVGESRGFCTRGRLGTGHRRRSPDPGGGSAAALASPSCATVLVATAPGSGMRASGFVADLRSDLGAGSSIARIGAPAVDGSPRLKDIYNPRLGVHSYLAGINAAITPVLRGLRRAATTCPDQPVVLVGYARGAMVVHRLEARLVATGDWQLLDRIAGAVLISDGDREPQLVASPGLGCRQRIRSRSSPEEAASAAASSGSEQLLRLCESRPRVRPRVVPRGLSRSRYRALDPGDHRGRERRHQAGRAGPPQPGVWAWLDLRTPDLAARRRRDRQLAEREPGGPDRGSDGRRLPGDAAERRRS